LNKYKSRFLTLKEKIFIIHKAYLKDPTTNASPRNTKSSVIKATKSLIVSLGYSPSKRVQFFRI
jgi:hypothetical protein